MSVRASANKQQEQRKEMKRENEFLKAEKHPLAGHLFIAEIYTRPIVEPKED